MGVTVVTGHRLEDLFEALLEQLASSPAGPMAEETILVPGQGIARWLELRIADHLGIAAGLQMPFFSAYLQRLGGDDSGSEHSELFHREVLVLRIWRLISERLRSSDAKLTFGPASDYCKHDEDGRKRLQLSTRLAKCFEEYQLYRDDLLSDFRNGDDHKSLSPHAPWQARLWRALLEDAGIPLPTTRSKKAATQDATPFLFAEMAEHDAEQQPSLDAAHRMATLRRKLADSSWCQQHLPPRLSVFGANTMPPAFLDLLHRMASQIDVHLYIPQPTPHYVGDLRGRKSRSGDNALLARFGAESREFQNLLLDLEDRAATGAEVFRQDLDDLDDLDDAAVPKTLLACLQQDIVHAFDRSEPGAEQFEMTDVDSSLRVHDCHSPQRELEVVRDQIFAALEEDASLQARDFLVLVPDIDRYAPYAHAVFGPLQYQLPIHIADRHPARELPICRTLLSVLELAGTRLTLDEVLQLLENPAVQRRFDLFPTDVPILRHLCQQVGIRWGLDGTSRHDQFDVPAFDDNAWRPGLDRLVLGGLTGPCDHLVLDRLPVADTTEARAELLAKFVTFAQTLFAQIAVLRHPHSLRDWADLLDTVASALLVATDGEQEDALRQWQRATILLRNSAESAQHTELVSPVALRDWLTDALAQGAPSRGFLGGSITIAAMLPMRAVPVRCLFVCGLDDASFPRQDKPSAFDLIAAKARPGDRNRRMDDRQLFLDLLLAARKQLHLLFVGHSAKDNAEGAPSVVLSELFEYVDRTCKSPDQMAAHKQLVVQHPLQPWSERYRQSPDPRLFTYGRDATPMPSDPKQGAEQTAWFPEGFRVGQPLENEPPVKATVQLALDDLLNFWSHPCRSFLRNALRVRIRDDGSEEDADEPFGLDNLARYSLQDAAVRAALRGHDEQPEDFAWTRAQGVLPVGAHGDATYHAVREDTRELRAAARQLATADARRIHVTVANTTITGVLACLTEHHHTYLRASKLKPKDRMRAWLQHLVLTMQRVQDGPEQQPAWPKQTRVLSRDESHSFVEIPEQMAHQQLAQLIHLFHEGHRRPLPFFESCSHSVATYLLKDKPPEEALQKGTQSFYPGKPSEAWQHDGGDAAIALCMRDRDPFAGGIDGEFFQLARDIWLPALEYLQEDV